MCEWKKHGDTRIDPCMREKVKNISNFFASNVEIVSCCCGHGKYPMSIVVEDNWGFNYEMFTFVRIMRDKRFYKRDKEGVYYIPETLNKYRDND